MNGLSPRVRERLAEAVALDSTPGKTINVGKWAGAIQAMVWGEGRTVNDVARGVFHQRAFDGDSDLDRAVEDKILQDVHGSLDILEEEGLVESHLDGDERYYRATDLWRAQAGRVMEVHFAVHQPRHEPAA